MDKTIAEADKDKDGKLSYEEFVKLIEQQDISKQMTLTGI